MTSPLKGGVMARKGMIMTTRGVNPCPWAGYAAGAVAACLMTVPANTAAPAINSPAASAYAATASLTRAIRLRIPLAPPRPVTDSGTAPARSTDTEQRPPTVIHQDAWVRGHDAAADGDGAEPGRGRPRKVA